MTSAHDEAHRHILQELTKYSQILIYRWSYIHTDHESEGASAFKWFLTTFNLLFKLTYGNVKRKYSLSINVNVP